MSEQTHIAVIGGGIIGACSALALVRRGYKVTLIEAKNPGGSQAASYGNGAFLSPASIIPMSVPGIWKKVPGYLFDAEGPLTIRWRYLRQLMPWLLKFLKAGFTYPKVKKTASVLHSLVGDSPTWHVDLAQSCGVAHFIRQDGLLYVYPDRAAFEADALSWGLRRDNGLVWQELSGQALHDFEPALNTDYQFAAFVASGAHCVDPGSYVAAIVAQAQKEGVTLVQAKATTFRLADAHLQSVLTDQGEIVCDRAVITAGIASKELAYLLGDDVPLESERGYHVEIKNSNVQLQRPVMPSDGKMSNVMTAGGFRGSGQVELATVAAEPDWRRCDILLKHLMHAYPALKEKTNDLVLARWYGHRPSTPDGLPVISYSSRTKDVVYAFGHGHVGLSAGPKTAQCVADLISDTPSVIDVSPFQVTRFQ